MTEQATLHLVSNKTCEEGQLDFFIMSLGTHDGILILNNALPYLLNQEKLREACSKLPSFALIEEVKTRGLQSLLPQQVQQISYDEFVTLTRTYCSIRSWP